MKTVKTILALFLTLALVATFAVSAFADTPADLNGHTFKAYQIFSASQAQSGELTDIEWTQGFDSTGLLSDLKSNDTFKVGTTNVFADCTTAKDVAKVLSQYTDDSAFAEAFAKIAYNHRGTVSAIDISSPADYPSDPGYYLVIDVTDFPAGATDTFYNRALLQMVDKNGFEIRVKAEYPTVEKKVKDVNDSVANSTSGWQDSADYDIGDSVPFQITATLSDMEHFSSYYFCLSDTLSKGLTAPKRNTAYKVYLKNSVNNSDPAIDITEYFDITWTTPDTAGLTTVKAECSNIKNIKAGSQQVTPKKGDKIILEYSATLNENAEIGSRGNDNTVYLEYSNNPNVLNSKGQTPVDLVRVFTYQLVVEKVDQNQQPLAGATFTLYKKNAATGDYELYSNTASSAAPNPTAAGSSTVANTFTWVGLDDGEYKIHEDAPTGYNSVPDTYFTVSATHEEDAVDPQLTALTGPTVADPTTGEVSNIQFTASASEGKLSTTIQNEQGVVLPETGDAGTQMLYIFGTALLLGGMILVVTKKRVNGEF